MYVLYLYCPMNLILVIIAQGESPAREQREGECEPPAQDDMLPGDAPPAHPPLDQPAAQPLLPPPNNPVSRHIDIIHALSPHYRKNITTKSAKKSLTLRTETKYQYYVVLSTFV